MAKFKVTVKTEYTYDYEVEAETKDEAEREALEMAKDGKDILWFDLQDVELVDSEEIENE